MLTTLFVCTVAMIMQEFTINNLFSRGNDCASVKAIVDRFRSEMSPKSLAWRQHQLIMQLKYIRLTASVPRGTCSFLRQ